MTLRPLMIGSAALLAVTLIGCTSARSPQGFAQAPVPVEREPRHQPRFENEHVRVLYVQIPPGETTLFHTHTYDGVGIRLTDAALRVEILGGTVEEDSVRRGAVSFSRLSSPVTHRVTNTGSTPFLNVVVELLSSSGESPLPQPPPPDTAAPVVLDNERVRVLRFAIPPGQSFAVREDTPRGVLVVLSGGAMERSAAGEAPRTTELRAGDVEWHGGGGRYALRNVGAAILEAVYVEVK